MADWLDSFADPTQQDILRAQVQALRQRNNPQDIAGQSRAAAMLGAFHDPGMQNMGKMLGSDAAARESETQPRLMGAMKSIEAGPQKDLGGMNPQNYKLRMEDAAIPRVASDMFGRYFARGPKAGQNIPGTGSMEQMISPEAIDQSAQVYIKTGQLPQFGRANPVVHGAILKRAAEMSGGNDLTSSRASVKADTESLGKMQQMSDAVDSFERTSMKNLDQFLAVAKQATDTGSPLLNQPARWFQGRVLGDPTVSSFHTARQVAVNEIAKVLNNPGMGGAAVSDSARHEIDGLIGPDATGAQIAQAATILKTDMANRKASNAQQLSIIKGRIGGAPPAAQAATPAAAPQVAPEDAQAMEWLKANPQHPSAAKVAAKLKTKGLLQ